MTPLRLQVCFHPDSDGCRELAHHLYDSFVARSWARGARIPVRFSPRREQGMPPAAIDWDAERTLVVVLVDARMARRARSQDEAVADAWGELLAGLIDDYGPGTEEMRSVLPVAVDAGAFELDDRLAQTSFVRLEFREGRDREQHLVTHVATRLLRLLRGLPAAEAGAVDELPEAPIKFFLSHAKKDLPRDPGRGGEGPVYALLSALARGPVVAWYDAQDIPAGGRFDEEIESGVLECSALIAVLTDAWSSREWCRREMLEAKEAGRPMIVVDAIESRVSRLFPYLGNVLTLRWRASLAPPAAGEHPDSAAWAETRAAWEREDAAAVLETALVEAVRHEHELVRLREHAREGEVVLGVPPEALTLAALDVDTRRVLYPDPPLGGEELDKLRLLRPELELSTPLTELARRAHPDRPRTVALSLSGSPDVDAYGGSPAHLASLADDLVLYLLVAGLRVAYGGILGHGGLEQGRAPDDGLDYVERLFGLARSHSELVRDLSGEAISPIENWVAWPKSAALSDAELALYGRVAKLRDFPCPEGLGLADEELEPRRDDGMFESVTPAQRYAWARSLAAMRQAMSEETSARVSVGGGLEGFAGLRPGVLEEALFALRSGKPVYPIGVFGGATRLLIDALRGVEREELTTAWHEAHIEGWAEAVELARAKGFDFDSPEALASELAERGKSGLAGALNNGLDDARNEILIDSDDPAVIVACILDGLASL